MEYEYTYPFPEFWTDLVLVNRARKSRAPTLLVSFDDFVAQNFNERHGVTPLTTWRLGKFMLVCIYVVHHKDVFDVGDLSVAGQDGTLVGKELCERVLKFAVENDVGSIPDFPEPSYFLNRTPNE
ncbi:MAG TPA: hypothetical protein VKV04_03740 [Verrucomicrobiae bacterium]|nr:hypothetical protein [Verrucomicrobiae bacterium]